MKHGIFGLLVIFLVVGFRAEAVYDTTWERPIFESEMVALDSDGFEIDFHVGITLTLNQRDGQPLPTSLTLTKSGLRDCESSRCGSGGKQKTEFTIYSVRLDKCGSLHYFALLFRGVNPDYFGSDLQPNQPMTVHLVDHTKRKCEDYRKFTWEVTTQNASWDEDYFGGSPRKVETPE